MKLQLAKTRKASDEMKVRRDDGGRWFMAITHLLLAQKTHERGQNLKRERKIGGTE